MDNPVLSLTNVAFDYGLKTVIRDVSHLFAAGKMTVICGPNGSGKSTLFRLMSGQDKPRKGKAQLGAACVSNLRAKTRAQAMAFLPQSPEAPPELLVRDLVALGRYAYRKPLSGLSRVDKEAIENAMLATDIAELADIPLANLSGGQKQRTWIAMALAQQSPLMLLDEPTNHLDISHAVETMHLLRQLIAKEGKTVVAVLHDINLMARFADDVVLLKDGKILAAGEFEQTVTEGSLTELYGRRCRFGVIAGQDRPFVVVE